MNPKTQAAIDDAERQFDEQGQRMLVERRKCSRHPGERRCVACGRILAAGERLYHCDPCKRAMMAIAEEVLDDPQAFEEEL